MLDKKTKSNATVAVAMSGGVDSSVAAALLKRQGYNVVGFFMKNWSETEGLKYSDCPWLSDRQDAMRAAAKLDIPFHTLEFEKEYKAMVLDYFFKEYEAGRTPNPDVLCNAKIKFGVFLEKAMELGADYIATGHYARLWREDTRYKIQTNSKFQIKVNCQLSIVNCQLLKAKDKNKDQTYFLHRLNQWQLSHSIFPIGDYTKAQVRGLAKKFGLPNYDKPDSQGVCFMGHIDLQKFLSQKIKGRPGDIVTRDGKVVGRHQGLHIFTIGQRRGIGVGGIGPFYVLGKDLAKKRLLVTDKANDSGLFKKEIIFTDANWISGAEPRFPLRATGRVRYREKLGSCVVTRTTPYPLLGHRSSGASKEGVTSMRVPSLATAVAGQARRGDRGGFYRATFKTPRWAVSSGQSLVLYKGEECLGGGVII